MKKQIGLYLENAYFKYKFNNEDLFRELEDAPEEEKPAIIEKILENNMNLIHYIIGKRYPNVQQVCQNIRVTFDDIFSVGYYAMLKAIHTYDIYSGNKFATYATMCIHNEYGMFMRKHKRSFTEVSIHKVTHNGDNGAVDNELTLLDMLIDPNDDIGDLILNDFGFIVMEEMERQLKPRELAILRSYIMDDEITQKDIAEQLGLSQSYISRILRKTLNKARKIYKKFEVV